MSLLWLFSLAHAFDAMDCLPQQRGVLWSDLSDAAAPKLANEGRPPTLFSHELPPVVQVDPPGDLPEGRAILVVPGDYGRLALHGLYKNIRDSGTEPLAVSLAAMKPDDIPLSDDGRKRLLHRLEQCPATAELTAQDSCKAVVDLWRQGQSACKSLSNVRVFPQGEWLALTRYSKTYQAEENTYQWADLPFPPPVSILPGPPKNTTEDWANTPFQPMANPVKARPFRYPPSARKDGLEQGCVVDVLVEEGRTSDVSVTECASLFHRPIEQSVSKWRWARSVKDGTAHRYRTQLMIRFQMEE